MKELTNAIFTAFNGNPSLTAAFPGGMFRDLATGTPAFPYLAWTIIAAPVVTVYGGAKRRDVTIRFTGFGEGHDAILTAMEAFTAAFDDTTLALLSGQNYDCLRQSEPYPIQEPALDKTATPLWQCPVTYVYRVR